MAKKKITITIDEEKLADLARLTKPSGQSASAWIEDAVTAKLERAERAERAVEWLVSRAREEHPAGFEEALAAVKAADERRGYAATEERHAA
ncbi:hypothetical protein ACWGCW_12880 [Streptomyces sp. NPDC054933]